jgi:hypothetical protein
VETGGGRDLSDAERRRHQRASRSHFVFTLDFKFT